MTIASIRLGALGERLALPLVAAPMFRVSGPDLVIAASRAGIIGAFPTSNCRTLDELDAWLAQMMAATRGPDGMARGGPVCPNLIIRQARLEGDLAMLVRHRVELVITSVGSPAPVIAPLHAIGCKVFADVASLAHARKAIAAGADGLVLLTAGAGGQTGWANPFAFVRAVRGFWDGPIVVAGGLSDGASLRAAEVLGADLGYMGTRFIAAEESLSGPEYRQMLVDCELDDVMTTRAFTGLASNMLRPSIVAAGLDPDHLDETVTTGDTRKIFGAEASGARRWRDIWSAGHSVSGVRAVAPASAIVAGIADEYRRAG
ncbi:NAD(P)H-dependent flavin oxidoreductase [Novosphingobium bradum]|uniref:NAD(P)H-dependent flavin oxidoreductase n=1 Tax=Novosphingobium bradum TaxID=1737444 RepID=A0ABV7ITM7_9SPHN